MAEANDELCLLIQVESKTALENLDAILEVEGIDGVFIGPADLSASTGQRRHPEVQRSLNRASAAFARRGKRQFRR
jgi:2-dehydro-3-deoxy-L-rhamnonate aldolase